ncbi:MAG: flagellar assembly peptidoglycan hydrolase FlgJ [Burkholderiaceae bacterium]
MINSTNNVTGSLATDIKSLSDLRLAANQNSPDALKGVAKQFEALFMNMIMKSMRDATPQDGMFDIEQTKMYTSMMDQQISQSLANRGVGLADMLVRQLSNRVSSVDAQGLPSNQGQPDALLKTDQTPAAAKPAGSQSSNVKAFQDELMPHAEAASRETGIPAKFMLGQAALESGWGKREIKAADGTSSHNLFGIKASADWKGKVVTAATTEYVNGVPVTKMEKFRAYDSYADSFRDYAKLLSSNPRYENVLANSHDASSFARGLQQAGYATDPHYAAKLTKIITQSLSA